MIATTRHCLSADELKSLISGNLPPESFDGAIEHLDHCESCQSAVHELETESSSSQNGNSMRFISEADASIESACQVAIGRLLTSSSPPKFQQEPLVENRKLGPYTILAGIGQGGMGMVYLAQHERLKRHCAIKFLPRSRVADAGWLERFDREMTTVAALEHPNIVRATDAGHEDGWHYLVMEFLDGLDVGKIASRRQRIAVADACRIVGQAALGLAYVHSRGLVHRDIKPSNIMVTRSGDVKLLDLGLVLSGDDPLAVHDRLTTAGHFLGTLPYMSPEQLLDCRHVDPASDVYSLGATLYRLIAGRVPHANRHGLASQVLAITKEPPTPLAEVIANVDPELSALVDRLLSHERTKRPTADEVAQVLPKWSAPANLSRLVNQAEQQSDSDASDAVSWGLMSQASKGPPRHRWPRWLAAGGAAASLIVAGLIFKIQTERGELIIESQVDDVTVVVKQGDTMVERLQVERGDNNRVSLRQGTYTVQIEGANNGLWLTDNRVVIARDRPTSIAVQNRTKSMPPQSSTSTEQRTYQGHPYPYWFDILTREQDAKTLSDAMRAVEMLSRDTPQRRESAEATMRLAKRLGGMVIGGEERLFDYMETMRSSLSYLFPEPGLTIVAETLRYGNERSRMAATCMLSDLLFIRWGSGRRAGTQSELMRPKSIFKRHASNSANHHPSFAI